MYAVWWKLIPYGIGESHIFLNKGSFPCRRAMCVRARVCLCALNSPHISSDGYMFVVCETVYITRQGIFLHAHMTTHM